MAEEEKKANGIPVDGDASSTSGNGNGGTEGEVAGIESITEESAGKNPAELLLEREKEIEVLQDRILRMAAETENIRKRLEREKADGISYANESLLRELLPVIDNLERAIEHAESEEEKNPLVEGVRMTLKGFLAAVAKFGCAPFEALGKPFDPNYHEAFMQQESSEYPEKTVMKELQKGYVLYERLLRPASVVVSKGQGA